MTQLLEDVLRATLNERVTDVADSKPRAEVRAQGNRIRRRRRLMVAAALAALAILVVVPALTHTGERRSVPASPEVVRTPEEELHQMAIGCGCLVAEGRTIEDGTTGQVVKVTRPDGFPLDASQHLRQVLRVGSSFVVVTSTSPSKSDPPSRSVSLVGAGGALAPLGQVAQDRWEHLPSRVAASADGSTVAFVRDAGGKALDLVVIDLTGRVLRSHRITDPHHLSGSPDVFAVDADGVWYSYVGPGKGPPNYWRFATDRVTRADPNGSAGDLLSTVGERAVINIEGSAALYDGAAPPAAQVVWRLPGHAFQGAFDRSGGYVLVVAESSEGRPFRLQLLDASSGVVLDQADLPWGVMGPQATGEGRWGLVAFTDDHGVRRDYQVSVGADRTLQVAETSVQGPLRDDAILLP